ncbi:NACHT domain-containing protein [Micromonospora halophytica]|uniref:NACHT domain-containing protein n=1 Tax=Micromonospora halophytica TaxID=47864 RepID=A0A1C5I0U5_9ACTN|nr:NACHT domain-containing protein [Micromonospora halophytica]SCG51854.1 NACHT domain-containing protein [Micromonospora halophytica]
MRWRPSAIGKAALPFSSALVSGLLVETLNLPGWWLWILVPATVVLTWLMIWEALRRMEAPGPPTVSGLPELADSLAVAANNEWEREQAQHRSDDPLPLPVSWHPAEQRLVDQPANVHGTRLGGRVPRLNLAGKLSEIAKVYARIPSGRLVILGKAGSGKTVLAGRLLGQILNDRQPGERVPLMFGLHSWDPKSDLTIWLAEQLSRRYPALSVPFEGAINLDGRTSRAAALVHAGLILPILDGFDEINPGLHEQAMRQLNKTTRLPLILISRRDEYKRAVKRTDVLSRAEGIMLDDLELRTVAEYLPRTTNRLVPGTENGIWQPVLTRLGEQPDDPAAAMLRQVLRTPLMVFLARAIYSDTPPNDPAELLDTQRFPTQEAVEEHLVAAYVPSAYHKQSTSGQNWHPDRAQRWLAHLAAHLETQKATDLTWWQLRDSIPLRERVRFLDWGWLVALVVAAMATGVATGSPAIAIFFMLLPGNLLVISQMHWIRDKPSVPQTRRVQLNLRELLFALSSGAMAGIPAGLFLFGVASDAVIGLVTGIAVGAAVTLGITFGIPRPLDQTWAVSVADSLSADRSYTLRRALLGGAGIMLAVGVVVGGAFGHGPAAGVVAGLMTALVIGPALILPCAWGQWLLLVRGYLAFTRRLPWRSVAFLQDACKRGILRQVGAVYQFRHSRLQTYLAQQHPSRAAPTS